MSSKGGKSLANLKKMYEDAQAELSDGSIEDNVEVSSEDEEEEDMDTQLQASIAAARVFPPAYPRKRKRNRDDELLALHKELLKLDRKKQQLIDNLTTKRKRPVSKWNLALKKWNTGKSSFQIPRKGTSDYNQVIEIMKLL